MKNSLAYLFATILFLSACDSNIDSHNRKAGDTIINLKETLYNKSIDSLSSTNDIAELFPGKDTLRYDFKMEAGQHVTIPVDVRSGDSIFGKLTSEDPSANIRFTQIALPDQTLDGPFGWELSYKLKGPGRYALIIGENIMAGDPWNGSFTLAVWVK